MSSGLIYAVIVGAWAAVLIPMWLRRHDERSAALEDSDQASTWYDDQQASYDEAGHVEDPADTGVPGAGAYAAYGEVRSDVAAGDGRVDDADIHDDVPGHGAARSAGSDEDTSGEHSIRAHSIRAHSIRAHSIREALERGSRLLRRPPEATVAGPRGRATLAVRRRRVLLALCLVTAVLFLLSALPGVGWPVPIVGLTVLGGYVAHLRVQARRAAERARRRRALQQRRGERQRQAAVTRQTRTRAPQRPREAGRGAAAVQADSARSTGTDAGRPSRAATGGGTGTGTAGGEAGGAEAGDDRSWEPVPVPLPTYVTKPRAPHPARVVDPNPPAPWTSVAPATGPGDATVTPPAAAVGEPEHVPVAADGTVEEAGGGARSGGSVQGEDRDDPGAAYAVADAPAAPAAPAAPGSGVAGDEAAQTEQPRRVVND